MYNIYNSLLTTAQAFPYQLAIKDEFGEISYQVLFEETEKLKSDLKKLNIARGDKIGVLCNDNRHFIICLYASVATGALVMPISLQQNIHEIRDNINEAGLQYLLGTQNDLALEYKHVLEVMPYTVFKTGIPANGSLLEVVPNPAFMRFTSGTTAKAKGVVLSHESVLERINAANELLEIDNNDRVLWLLPMAYHFVVSIVLYIHRGASIIVNNDFFAEGILKTIQGNQASFFYGSPVHIKLLAAYPASVDISSLRMVISTTAGISSEACQIFKNKYHLAVSQAFGIIEIGLPIINNSSQHKHPEAVGYTLPAYHTEVLNDDFEPVALGHLGVLGVKGPGMFDAYLNPLILRAEVLQNGWFVTGDIAVKNEDGLIFIKGRKKEVMNVHGNKVFPGEVEAVLNRYEGVEVSRVFAKQHPLVGEVIEAEVIINGEFEEEKIIEHCHEYLSTFKVPKRIRKVDNIERTGSGKIKRH